MRGVRRQGIRFGSTIVALVTLLGCNAILGISEGTPRKTDGGADAGDCTSPTCNCFSACATCTCEHYQDPTMCSSACGSGGSAGSHGTGGAYGTGGSGVGGSYGAGGYGTGGYGTGGSSGTGPSGTGGAGSGGASSCPGAPAGSPCSLVAPQCGCGPGLGCYVKDDGSTYCAAAGSVQPYQSCGSGSECAPGGLCLYHSGKPTYCAPYCKTDSDCAGYGACLPLGKNQGTGSVPNAGYCASGCDLDNPAATCGAGLGCYTFQTASGGVTTDCYPVGTATGANGCASNQSACAPGYVCLTSGDCRRWCRVDKNDCPSGTSCTSLTPNVVVNGINYGVCL